MFNNDCQSEKETRKRKKSGLGSRRFETFFSFEQNIKEEREQEEHERP